MGKVSVGVRIPAVGKMHDFSIPAQMAVKEVVALIVRILVSEYGVSGSLADLELIDESDGKALRSDCNFAQLGISDGAKLILV